MTDRVAVALIRGEALNPYELQSYAHLGPDVDVLAVGREQPQHEVGQIAVPVRLLPSSSQRRVVRAVQRRWADHLPASLGADRLIGLKRVVRGRRILHAAETVLPVTEQAAEIALADGVQLVLTCWETIPFRYDDDAVLAARKRVVKAAASHYIAVTERARSALLLEGVAAAKVTVIPAGVDTDRFAPRPPADLVRESWGVPRDAVVLLYVGRLIQEKGLVELVRALAEVPRQAHLVLVGAGDQTERVRIAAAALGVVHRVHVRSSMSYADLPLAYAAADVVVAPSLTTPYWEEQFGMVLAEAMACGRPLVTTRSGAIPEVVGDAAVLVDPYDIGQLTAALSALVGDPAARQRLGTAGRRRVEARYALPVVAEQIRSVYDAVLGR